MTKSHSPSEDYSFHLKTKRNDQPSAKRLLDLPASYNLEDEALFNLRDQISRITVAEALKAARIEPTPERGRKISWCGLSESHRDTLAAIDFFIVVV